VGAELDRLLALMSEADRASTMAAYTPVEPGSPEAAGLVDRYPILSTQAIGVLRL